MFTSRQRRAALPAAAFFLLACGHELPGELPASLGESAESSSVIVNDVDWLDVTWLDESSLERESSRAVGYLSIPARGTRCTAFLIAPDVVMTNQHCIPTEGAAEGATVSFRRESGVNPGDAATYSCATFLGNDAALDFALLQCSGRPGDHFGVLELDARQATPDEPVYVIHQNCDYFSSPGCNPTKRYSPGRVTAVGSRVSHNADTLGGSSGAPVLSPIDHRVFALHNAGVGNAGAGRGWANRAVPMALIVPTLEAHFPGVQLGGEVAAALPAPLLDDAFEPNDTADTGTPLTPPIALEELTLTEDEQDWFTFELSSPAELDALVSFSNGAGDLDVALFVSGRTEPLVRGVSGDDDERLQVQLGAGRFYLVVYGYAGASNAYSVALALTSP